MKVCIDIPGSITHGMWSPERGESRWAQNIAVALAHMGIDVYCLGVDIPQWGSCPPVQGIQLVPWNGNYKHTCPDEIRRGVDIYIDSCWYEGKPSADWINAKAYWHVHFGFESRLKTTATIKDDRHWIVYPYKVSGQVFLSDENPFKERTFFCPCPFWIDQPEVSKFHNKGLLWSGKDCFLNRFLNGGQHLLEDSSLMLDVLTDLSNEYSDIPISFLMAYQLDPRWHETCDALKQYDVVNRLSKIQNKRMYKKLTYGEVLGLLRTTQVVTPPHWCGSHLESIATGVVPLIRQGFIYDEGALETNSLLPQKGGDKKQIIDQIKHLMFDEIYYNKCLKAYQEDMKEHSEKYVRDVIVDFVRRI